MTTASSPRAANPLRRVDLRHLAAMTGSSPEVDWADGGPCVSELLPETNNVIRGQENSYAIGKKLMPGRFGGVFQVLRRSDGRAFAAKLEVVDTGFHGLNLDFKVLKAANKVGLNHFCDLIDRGKIEGHFKFVVMQLLDTDLYRLRHQFVHQRFSGPTTLRLALETLQALEELHSLGFVHRDVKPSNFLVRNENGLVRVFIVDFGVCRSFRAANGKLKAPRDECRFRGTTRYASLTAHMEQEQTQRDDLESWLYMLAEMLSGELPWEALHKPDRDTVRRLKEEARSPDGSHRLFRHCPRTEFRRIMNYLDTLTFYSQPDYTFLRQMVQLAMRNNDIKGDEPYDWEQAEALVSTEEPSAVEESEVAGPKQTRNIVDGLNSILQGH